MIRSEKDVRETLKDAKDRMPGMDRHPPAQLPNAVLYILLEDIVDLASELIEARGW